VTPPGQRELTCALDRLAALLGAGDGDPAGVDEVAELSRRVRAEVADAGNAHHGADATRFRHGSVGLDTAQAQPGMLVRPAPAGRAARSSRRRAPAAACTPMVISATGRFDHGGASITTATRPRETSTIPQARWPAARRRCAAARRPMSPAPARRLGSGRTRGRRSWPTSRRLRRRSHGAVPVGVRQEPSAAAAALDGEPRLLYRGLWPRRG
jgi:hypothetical protein